MSPLRERDDRGHDSGRPGSADSPGVQKGGGRRQFYPAALPHQASAKRKFADTC